MSVITYTILAYLATAVISFGIVAVIVLINRVFSSTEEKDHD